MVPTPAQIRAQVAAILEKAPEARVIGIRAPVAVETGGTLRVRDAELPVVLCESALEVRERLLGAVAGTAPLVLLTPLSEGELGADVLARLAKRHLFSVEPWQLVKERFRARYVDPRLVQRHAWVARALLEAEPEGGYPPTPSGFLEAELVWQVLFRALLGLGDTVRDAEAVLEWSLDDSNRARARSLDGERLQSLALAVEEGGGALARRVFECATGDCGDRAVAVGLVARVIYPPSAQGDAAAAKATGKLEALLGGGELPPGVALGWAAAAEAVLQRAFGCRPFKEVRPILTQADALLGQLGVPEAAHRSRFLAAGYEQRLTRFAEALGAFVRGKAKTVPTSLTEAAEAALEHALAGEEPARAERVEMAMRLVRWLAEQRAQGEPPAGSLADAARAYRQGSGYVDWARGRIRDGDPLGPLGKAYTSLWEDVLRLREAENTRFGVRLANWTATGSYDRSVIPVEDLLERAVVPLARVHPVLLVLVDGMGMAVFRELQADLARRGWVEVDTAETTGRLPVIAALPTVTEVSRASLLCGKLAVGAASEEKEGFGKHTGLVSASEPPKPPVLYHKGDLTEGGAVGVTAAVLTAVADLHRRVVGVVINAVDDHLAKGEQVRVDWNVHRIRPLEELLSAARDAGRAVIVVSDHGHVPEHDTVARGEEPAERWREAAGSPREDEVFLQGPRVLLGKGKRLFAPWSERVRYGNKKNGYHGGASPQEVVIPLGVFVPSGVAVQGWSEVPPETPYWWEGEIEAAPPLPAGPPRATKPRAPRVPNEQGRLFPPPLETAAAAPSAGPEWITRLLTSEVMAAQRRLASRVALPEERVRVILSALEERGGKLIRPALARRVGVHPQRLAGVLSALRRLLNVDGYAVLNVDEASDTVELNRQQLFKQFGL